jgi:DNA-binding winged helix-turn-helix (wHTH) protein/Flp pilus assembly protein TadD
LTGFSLFDHNFLTDWQGIDMLYNKAMSQSPAACQIDDLTVDFVRRKVTHPDRGEIELSALSFDTLKALIEAAPAALTADELIDRAWRGAIVSDEAVTQRIRLLRKALNDDSRTPRYIETQRNAGYRLIPPVSEQGPVATKRMAVGKIMVGAVVFLLVATVLVWMRQGNEPTPAEASLSTFPQGPVTAAELTEQASKLVGQRNPESLHLAIELYEKALLLEPNSREVLTGLSLALSTSVAWYGDKTDLAHRSESLALQAMTDGAFFKGEMALAFSLDAQGMVEPAHAAYERAVALDPENYGARASLAYLLQVEGRLVEALSHNMIAYERAPPGILDTQIASCLRLLGFYRFASEWLDRSDKLDPDSAHAAPMRALDLMTRKQFEQSRVVIRDALARGVEQVEFFEYLVVLALLDQDLDAARTAIDSAPESINHRGPIVIWRLIIETMESGDTAAAMALRDEILRNVDNGETWPGNFLYVAMLNATAQRSDDAILALQRLVESGYRDFLWLQLLPPLATLHDDPRFDAIISSMRNDVERQREQVLTAEWLPQELRVTAADSIGQ